MPYNAILSIKGRTNDCNCRYAVAKVPFFLQHKQNKAVPMVHSVHIPVYIHISLKWPNVMTWQASSDLWFGAIVDTFAVT